MKVSVIIPVYNTKDFLRQALDSALAQTLDDVEVIAVDDGSNDGSGDILSEYSDRIRVIKKSNAGQAAARNDALGAASGRYVYFMDSDDIIEPDTLEKCFELCEKDKLDFAFFDASSFGGASKDSAWADYHRAAFYPGIRDGVETMERMLEDKRYRCSVCMSLFRKSFLDSNGIRFMPGIIHEDELFSALVYFNARRIEGIPTDFYLRRIRNDSTMTSAFSKRNVDGYLTVIRETDRYVAQKAPYAGNANRLLVKSIMLALMQNGYLLGAKDKLRILAALAAHPYSFRFKPFCILLFKRFKRF